MRHAVNPSCQLSLHIPVSSYLCTKASAVHFCRNRWDNCGHRDIMDHWYRTTARDYLASWRTMVTSFWTHLVSPLLFPVSDHPFKTRIYAIRSVIGRNYSFIHFLSIVAIPTFYWVSVVELGCFFARNDEEFSLSFGQASYCVIHLICQFDLPAQVMAIFVALPPLIQTILLYPMLFEWFRTLTWVRRIYGPKNGRLEEGDQINLVMAMAPTTQDDADDDWKSVIETADYTSVHRHDSYQTTHRSSKIWKDIQ